MQKLPAHTRFSLKHLNRQGRGFLLRQGIQIGNQCLHTFLQGIRIQTKFKNIQLVALHPLDIVVTKIGRLNPRDEKDILDCIKKFKLSEKQIRQRGQRIVYIGRPENYEHNLEIALKKVFQKKH